MAKIDLRLVAALLAIVFPVTGYAQEPSAHALARQDLEAKIHYCKDCHGQSGQGFSGAHPIPRLAGQTIAYLKGKFQVITEHKEDNPTAETFMAPVLGSVDPIITEGVASHFSTLNPPPASDGPQELVTAGKKIYEEGILDANVPACAACHGPDAKGVDQNPRLAGQVYRYTLNVLMNWHKAHAKNPPAEGPLAGKSANAHSVTQPQVEAVAAFLSH